MRCFGESSFLTVHGRFGFSLASRCSLTGALLLAACSGDREGAGSPDAGRADPTAVDASSVKGGQSDGAVDPSNDGSKGNPLSVGKGSDLCNVDLPLRPRGCACEPGQKVSCWSGQPGLRGHGKCHDGVQTCEADGEFGGSWGGCVGEELDCGEQEGDAGVGDAGVPEECGCIPGSIVTCSEDCSELIICSLTGTKVCQPDGTFGPCREGNLENLFSADPCRNVFFGCLANNFQGLFLGLCDKAFTCGHPPGLLPPAPTQPKAPAVPDAGTSTPPTSTPPTNPPVL